ncbi:hypothetical protein EYV94_13335 [Puteibacter caeruleilacunae]|nr:hypothetical protein EYV94_13335 [Puteibacter caeruleilacunae]
MSFWESNRDEYQKILKATEKKFNRGTAENWKNKDFEDLSFVIKQKAKILISPATLKRMYGKVKTRENYLPQDSTIEALIVYAEYSQNESTELKKTPQFKKWYLVAFAIPFLIWGIIVVWNNLDFSENLQGQLTLEKVEGNGPATAFFKYSVPESKDSIFLDFDDATWLRHAVGTNRHISHFYGSPGYFNARLKTREKRISDNVKVLVPTKGWQALANYFGEEYVDRYYPVPFHENVENGVFHATRKNLASLGMDSTKIVVVRLDNYRRTEKSGDAFTLKTRFMNSSFWPAVRCFSVHFKVQGTQGSIMFKFVGEGCSHHAEYRMGEKHATGGTSDLTQFAIDLYSWSDVTIKNANKEIVVEHNGNEIFKGKYTRSIGKIVGSTIYFHGSGTVDYINVIDEDGKNLFTEMF